jgi:hypothetical protein
MKKYDVRDIKNINIILDHLHDRNFLFDEIVFDSEKGSLKIPITVLGEEEIDGKLLFIKRRKMKVYDAELLIYNVLKYELVDNAKIGLADISTVYVDGDNLIIKSGLPVTMVIRISMLHLELIVTDNIVSEFTYYFYPLHIDKVIDPKWRKK